MPFHKNYSVIKFIQKNYYRIELANDIDISFGILNETFLLLYPNILYVFFEFESQENNFKVEKEEDFFILKRIY